MSLDIIKVVSKMNRDYISTSALYGPYLAHHGIKGQKWGTRRYQNEDGTLTSEGKLRYLKDIAGNLTKYTKYSVRSENPGAYAKDRYGRLKRTRIDPTASTMEGKGHTGLAKIAYEKGKKYVDNYSEKQRAYDKKIYGAGSVRRINKRMANGEGIKSARHNEVVRKKNISTAKTVAGIAGSALLVTAGSIAVSKFLQQKGVSLEYAPAFKDAAINIGQTVIHRFL